MGNTKTEQHCAAKVRNENKEAKGAKWDKKDKRCWAKLGGTLDEDENSPYRICLFPGIFI